jgi:hypothetical protein
MYDWFDEMNKTEHFFARMAWISILLAVVSVVVTAVTVIRR